MATLQSAQLEALQEHACAVGDLAGEMIRYLDATAIADTYPAPALVLRNLLQESAKRAGLLIYLGNEIAGD